MFAPLIQTLSRFFAIRPGDAYRLGIMASLFFLLLAANNLIKVLRDSIFLGHHSVSELPYLYILVAVFAGAIISIYTRYTVHLSLVRLILATNALIILMIAGFWFLLTYIDPGWSHYAFYIWSAMVSAIAVAQLWTLATRSLVRMKASDYSDFLPLAEHSAVPPPVSALIGRFASRLRAITCSGLSGVFMWRRRCWFSLPGDGYGNQLRTKQKQ